MGTDFFDDDLLQTNNPRRKNIDKNDGAAVQPISEASLSRMTRQKEELSNQVAGAVQEIERLRKKQEELEKEKSELEELTRKQEEYKHGKRDIMDKLEKSIILIEKEELEATGMAELLSEMRGRFKNMMAQLRKIDEETWSDENFQPELNKSLVLVENARMDYKKALAKIDAASWHKNVTDFKESAMVEEMNWEQRTEKGFGYWLKLGFAITLPLAVILVILFVVYLFVTSGWI